ncbi:MAG: MBOAT family protein [Verrucomicrobiaceae bacterium]
MGWLLVLGLIGVSHLVLLEVDPIVRMAGVCAVLLGGMKGLVYAEWGGRLGGGRYLIFGLLWFGMDPGSFEKRREGLSWKGDLKWGILMMVVGTVGAWVVWEMGWRQILVMFVPMSLGFHFGALRVLKGLHRRAGFPVRTLFPNLLKARGVGDFWGRRWNVGYSQMMQRVVGRPVGGVLGNGAGVMAVFVVSGLLHEVAITLVVQEGWGLPTLYFTLHGLLTLVEVRWGRRFGRLGSLLLVALPLGWLFPAAFQSEVIERCLSVMNLIN